MACVTLKRPLDHFDSLHVHSPTAPHHHHHHVVHRGQPPNKRRRCMMTFNQHRDSSLEPSQTSTSTSLNSLVFRETPLSPSEIANKMRDELKRLRRRKQIDPYEIPSTSRDNGSSTQAPNSPEPMMDDATAVKAALMATSMASPTSAKSAFSSGEGNKPIFTLKQMTMICEKMCKERAVQIREEYDRILQQKLSEQYDSFVRFIDHQIQQRFKDSQAPSYLS